MKKGAADSLLSHHLILVLVLQTNVIPAWRLLRNFLNFKTSTSKISKMLKLKFLPYLTPNLKQVFLSGENLFSFWKLKLKINYYGPQRKPTRRGRLFSFKISYDILLFPCTFEILTIINYLIRFFIYWPCIKTLLTLYHSFTDPVSKLYWPSIPLDFHKQSNVNFHFRLASFWSLDDEFQPLQAFLFLIGMNQSLFNERQ